MEEQTAVRSSITVPSVLAMSVGHHPSITRGQNTAAARLPPLLREENEGREFRSRLGVAQEILYSIESGGCLVVYYSTWYVVPGVLSGIKEVSTDRQPFRELYVVRMFQR